MIGFIYLGLMLFGIILVYYVVFGGSVRRQRRTGKYFDSIMMIGENGKECYDIKYDENGESEFDRIWKDWKWYEFRYK